MGLGLKDYFICTSRESSGPFIIVIPTHMLLWEFSCSRMFGIVFSSIFCKCSNHFSLGVFICTFRFNIFIWHFVQFFSFYFKSLSYHMCWAWILTIFLAFPSCLFCEAHVLILYLISSLCCVSKKSDYVCTVLLCTL